MYVYVVATTLDFDSGPLSIATGLKSAVFAAGGAGARRPAGGQRELREDHRQLRPQLQQALQGPVVAHYEFEHRGGRLRQTHQPHLQVSH